MEKLSHILSRTPSGGREADDEDELKLRAHVPFLSGPLDKKHGNRASSINGSDGGDVPIFKHHHEASTIELFYDLFFVANLSVFTLNHEIINGQVFKSYLGFFTLMWMTWFQVCFLGERVSTCAEKLLIDLDLRRSICIRFGV